jgi:hypothetical protein
MQASKVAVVTSRCRGRPSGAFVGQVFAGWQGPVQGIVGYGLIARPRDLP